MDETPAEEVSKGSDGRSFDPSGSSALGSDASFTESDEGTSPVETSDYESPDEDETSDYESPDEDESEDGTRGIHDGWGSNDQRTEEDHLDFNTYVSVLYDFLTHTGTKPPLTVSIEGEWGTGKSSFMALLRNAIEETERERRRRRSEAREGQRKDDETQYFTVEFNPWRHEREDALWAAFMLEFFDQITDRKVMSFRDRWRGHLLLARHRLQWRHGWRDLLRLGLVVPLVLLVVWFPNVASNLGLELDTFGARVGRGASVFAIGLWAWQNFANPIETELRTYISNPDYESRVSFIERFHADFDDILDAYTGTDSKVFVFIDDLDRCPPSKAAELIQSINLMISSNDSRVFFLLGMDRDKVAAGLAAKHEDLLRYLRASEYRSGTLRIDRGVDDDTTQSPDGDAEPHEGETDVESASRALAEEAGFGMEEYGLGFADNYLEKFVQIPFHVPRPREKEIGKLVRSMVEDGRARTTGSIASGIGGPERPRNGDEVLPEDRLVRIGEMMAPALEYNPRVVKTFVNLLRLQTMLAVRLDLIDERITVEQLAKFVAISIEWPPLTEALRDTDDTSDLTEWALTAPEGTQRPDVPGASRVPKRDLPRLASLLAVGVDGSDGENRYRLEEVPEELFWTSSRPEPSRVRTDETPTAP